MSFASTLARHRVVAVVTGAVTVVALGASGSVAAHLIGSSDIRNNSVRSVDVKNDTLRSRDVKNGTLKLKDVTPAFQAKVRKGAAAQAEVLVKRLSGPWSATNPSVSMTPDGVEFGPYADGGQSGGSVAFTGLNGKKLSDIRSLSYYARYLASNDTGGVGAPYLRVFLDGDSHDVIFSPNTQSPDMDVAEGPFHDWVTTQGSWRYDDDGDQNPAGEMSWNALKADHGDAVISGIYLSTGFSNGTDLSALLRSMEINGTEYVFRG